ncbi:MAG: DUF975 family protein [Clostridia bacterium]|nr:DUF975 family protein [Clostridia bacterium]
MNIKNLKQAGKNLFQKNYWYSVLVAFLMAFTGTTGSTNFNFSFNTSTSSSETSPFDALFGSEEYSNTFFEEFFLFDKNFLEDLIQHPFAIVFFIALFSTIAVAAVLGYLIFSSFRCGGIRYFLKSRKNQPVQIHEVFQNLKDKTNFNIGKVLFFRDISVMLWSLLFVIPGIVKSYEYWAVEYILAVRPDIDKDEAKRLSRILMDGNKWNCFVLGFSFIGWNLLAIFTFGLLNIFYINPYMQATFVEFFSEIRLQALAMGKITPNDIPDYEFIDLQMQYQQAFYQQPKNIVYRPDGMPINNVNYNQQPFTPPTYQQNWNNPYAPQQPASESVAEPVVDNSAKEPVSEPAAEFPTKGSDE